MACKGATALVAWCATHSTVCLSFVLCSHGELFQPPKLQTLALFFPFFLFLCNRLKAELRQAKDTFRSTPSLPVALLLGQPLVFFFHTETVQSPALLSWSDTHCTSTYPRIMSGINLLIACSNKVCYEIQALPEASLILLPHLPCSGCWKAGQALRAPCLFLSQCPSSLCTQS